MSDNVTAMHPYLVAPVTSCYTCPMAFLLSVAPWGGDQKWGCTAEKLRTLGSERSTTGSPDWCPLKRQPVLVKWKGAP